MNYWDLQPNERWRYIGFMNETIWITGAQGKLGSQLVQLLEENTECKIIDTDKEIDISDMKMVDQAVDVYRPAVIINCASISDTDYCEKNMVEAFKVNALGARNLATASRRINAKIIQMSTDDIFDGKETGMLTEFDTPSPQNVYGKSKLAGENYVRELNPKHLIIRSSWVYGTATGDYFSFVVDKAKKNESFEAATDVFSTPTSAIELAKFVEFLMDKSEYGIYHASCEGVCSRFDFAKAILDKMGLDNSLVKPVNANAGGVKTSTHLENLMLKMTQIYEMKDWNEVLDEYVEIIKEDCI